MHGFLNEKELKGKHASLFAFLTLFNVGKTSNIEKKSNHKQLVFLYAKRNIKKGEQLLIDQNDC